MRVIMAYASVVFIWATTPLAVKWSSESLTFIAAIASRVALAFVISFSIMQLFRRPLIQSSTDWRAFSAGLLGVFPNMLVVYWSAQHVSSGIIAVLFGFYPFMVGIFSYFILKENIFTPRRIVALFIALLGLAVINLHQFSLGENAALGALGIIASTAMFGLSSVLVKHVGEQMDPFRQSTGILLLATPLFAASWWYLDGEVPTSIGNTSLAALAYLVVGASVVGGPLFFFVLRYCKVSTVGLITFMSPIMAIGIGASINNEQLTREMIFGSSLVIASLAIYQDVPRIVMQFIGRLFKTKPKLDLSENELV